MNKKGLDHVGIMLQNTHGEDDKVVKEIVERFDWSLIETVRLEKHNRTIYWVEADGGVRLEFIALDEENSRPWRTEIDHIAFKGRPPIKALEDVREIMSIPEMGVEAAFFNLDGYNGGRVEYVDK